MVGIYGYIWVLGYFHIDGMFPLKMCRRNGGFTPGSCMGGIPAWTRQIHCQVNSICECIILTLVTFWFMQLWSWSWVQLCRVWKKFHNSSDKAGTVPFQFTFPEFVRLVVNGSREFSGDEYISQVPSLCLRYLTLHSSTNWSLPIGRLTMRNALPALHLHHPTLF